jgi:Flp pilus assembly pilin Flp
MTNLMKRFWIEEEGQDLIEYTLLLAFVCLVAAGIFISSGQAASDIWTIASSTLGNASTAASS